MSFKKMMRLFVEGNYVVDLTDSTEELARLRDIIEGDCVWIDPESGNDYDFGADLFWSEDQTRVVIVW